MYASKNLSFTKGVHDSSEVSDCDPNACCIVVSELWNALAQNKDGSIIKGYYRPYYDKKKSIHFSFDLVAAGSYLTNIPFSDRSGSCVGAELYLVMDYFSIDYIFDYKYFGAKDLNENNIKIYSQYFGVKLVFLGVYLNYSYYKSKMLDNNYGKAFGFTYSLFFPAYNNDYFSAVIYFRNTFNIENKNLTVNGEKFNPVIFDLGLKFKL